MNPHEYLRMFEAEDRHWWYVGLHEVLLAHLRREADRLGRSLDVLDAGCGTGRLCQLLAREGHRVEGLDTSEEALRLCRGRGLDRVCLADLDVLEPPLDRYDAIALIDVLYHAGVTDDVAVMRRLGAALRPGGLLLIHVPALEALRSRHDVAVHTRERYTRAILSDRIRAAGLRVERIGYRVGLLFPLVAAHRLASRALLPRDVRAEAVRSDTSLPAAWLNAILLGVTRLEARLARWVPMPIGSSLLAVARRPATPPIDDAAQ